MKFIEEKKEERHLIVTVQASEDLLKDTYNSYFNQLSKKISVPGFRKGHASVGMVCQYLKQRGTFDSELKKMLDEVISKCVSSFSKTNPELDKKIFGYPISSQITDLDLSQWKLIFESKFELFPQVILGDYSSISTLIEYKEFDGATCPVPDPEATVTKDSVVAISMKGNNKEGKLLYQYIYDMLEIDMIKTTLRSEIIDALMGSKAMDKKEISFDEDGQNIKLEINVLEVRKKCPIDEDFKKLIGIPDETPLESVIDTIKKQYEMNNSFMKYQDILKWLFSDVHQLEPLPIENLRFEAQKLMSAHKNLSSQHAFTDILLQYIKNLKTTLVLEEIAKKENISVTDEDKSLFAADIENHPWLYGNKKVEEIFNGPNDVVDDYVKQFKTIQFLNSRWKFKI